MNEDLVCKIIIVYITTLLFKCEGNRISSHEKIFFISYCEKKSGMVDWRTTAKSCMVTENLVWYLPQVTTLLSNSGYNISDHIPYDIHEIHKLQHEHAHGYFCDLRDLSNSNHRYLHDYHIEKNAIDKINVPCLI